MGFYREEIQHPAAVLAATVLFTELFANTAKFPNLQSSCTQLETYVNTFGVMRHELCPKLLSFITTVGSEKAAVVLRQNAEMKEAKKEKKEEKAEKKEKKEKREKKEKKEERSEIGEKSSSSHKRRKME